MRIFKLTVLCGLLVQTAQPASADWQTTKWGMTEVEVKTAAASQVHMTGNCSHFPDDPPGFSLSFEYSTGDLAFRGCMNGTDTSGLKTVGMSLLDPTKGYRLKDELTGKYGAPILSKGLPGSEHIEWQTKQDRITFDTGVTTIAGSAKVYAMLKYEPLVNATNRGL